MLEVFTDIDAEATARQAPPQEYEIDFETGQMTGRKVSGVEAIKVWAWFALQVARYRYRQFTWNYGTEAEDLIGKNYGVDYEISELQRYITECLTVHPNVTEVSDFVTSFEGTTLTAKFTLVTDFGATTMEAAQEVE